MKSWAAFFIPLFFAVNAAAFDGPYEVRVQRQNQTLATVLARAARTPSDLAQGLMFRRELPADEGLLFYFGKKAVSAMWMKNTFIPLDVLFFDEDGTILHIVKNMTPHSLSRHSSVVPVAGALEVNAGFADKNGLRPTDRLVVSEIVQK